MDDINDLEVVMGITGLFFVGLCCLAIYILPSIIAICRRHEYQVVIILVNIFCAWTGLVWLAILAWSVWPRDKRLQGDEFYRFNFQNWQRPQTPPPFSFGDKASFTDEQLASLEKLGHLRKEGILSEEEFAQAKKKILTLNG